MKRKRDGMKEMQSYCEREAKEHLDLSRSIAKDFSKESPRMQVEAERLALIALGQSYGFEQALKYLKTLNARRN